jgi:hypothetical protein
MTIKRIAITCFLFGLLTTGCVNVPGNFVLLSRDHAKVTSDTTSALVLSIKDELAKPNITEEERAAFTDLIKRLEYMNESADVMEKYISQNFSNTETEVKIAQLILKIHKQNN